MPCCAKSGFEEKEINGTCPDCGEQTVDGEAFEKCGYEEHDPNCETCGHAPCGGAC